MHGSERFLLCPGQRALGIHSTSESSLAAYVEQHRARLRHELLEHGALLFRGFEVRSVADFSDFVAALASRRMEYVYRSTPRSAVGDGIFTATEYPAGQEIPLHNENAYQRRWPLQLAFCCLIPAATGGQTPLADMRRVTALIPSGVLEKFRSRQVTYVRHYHTNVDIPWRTVFQTDDRATLAGFCADNFIEHSWLDEETLRTWQTAQGVARHPSTGEELFFNQAHLFHVSSVGAETAECMLEVFGQERLPRHARFGDGSEIPAHELDTVRACLHAQEMVFSWQAGDVMLLDNMQMAHGRQPFTGTRKVLAALLDPYP